ncbi:conserved protein, unknown function, partial [Hepatocystis sp. ex Piliocolobus tephrosceles]
MLQEAIRLSIIGCNERTTKMEVNNTDSYYDVVKKNFDSISYYLCNSHVLTKNKDDIIDNKLFWKDIYKHYKNIYIIIKDYIYNLYKRNEKINKKKNEHESSNDDYDFDDSSDCSNSSSSCCSLGKIKKKYNHINYTTKNYCAWLRKGNRSKSLNDHVFINYVLNEMNLVDDTNSIHNLVFGVNNFKYSNKLDIQKWCNHSINFFENKHINFGLKQFLSGPCGVISSIQGYIIIILLFNYNYHFLWNNNYFSILKTNNDFLNLLTNSYTLNPNNTSYHVNNFISSNQLGTTNTTTNINDNTLRDCELSNMKINSANIENTHLNNATNTETFQNVPPNNTPCDNIDQLDKGIDRSTCLDNDKKNKSTLNTKKTEESTIFNNNLNITNVVSNITNSGHNMDNSSNMNTNFNEYNNVNTMEKNKKQHNEVEEGNNKMFIESNKV